MRESQPVKRSCGVSMIFDREIFVPIFSLLFGFEFFSNLRSFKVMEFHRNEFRARISFVLPFEDLINLILFFVSLNKNFHRDKFYSRENSD